MAGWGIGQGEGEEIDEGEAATTTTAMMTAQFFLFPLGQTFVDQARATLPLTLRCHGRRCCGGAMFGRWGFPPLLRRGGPCATTPGILAASQQPRPLLPSQPWPSQPWPPAALGPRCCRGFSWPPSSPGPSPCSTFPLPAPFPTPFPTPSRPPLPDVSPRPAQPTS